MSKTALIVDDSPSMRKMVSHTLRSAGYAVIEGGDGQEGLDQLERSQVDVVITDLNMPVMDGLQMITRLRGLPRHRFTPVLMLTTEHTDAKKQAGRAAGATGWIVKPFNPQQLLQIVARVLS